MSAVITSLVFRSSSVQNRTSLSDLDEHLVNQRSGYVQAEQLTQRILRRLRSCRRTESKALTTSMHKTAQHRLLASARPVQASTVGGRHSVCHETTELPMCCTQVVWNQHTSRRGPFSYGSCIRPPFIPIGAVLKSSQKTCVNVGGNRGDRISIRVQALLWFDLPNDVLNGRRKSPQNSMKAEMCSHFHGVCRQKDTGHSTTGHQTGCVLEATIQACPPGRIFFIVPSSPRRSVDQYRVQRALISSGSTSMRPSSWRIRFGFYSD